MGFVLVTSSIFLRNPDRLQACAALSLKLLLMCGACPEPSLVLPTLFQEIGFPAGYGLSNRAFGRGSHLNGLKKSIENYNEQVARGWESKSVEAQQAEANERSSNTRPPMSAEEAARWREKESLRLSRQIVLQQLGASTNPRHRALLQDSLADLDQKLSKIESHQAK